MRSKKTVIVGYDSASPLGTEMEDQWRRAASGESGIGELTRFPIGEKFPVRIAGQVDDIDTAPYPFLSERRLAQWTSPIFKYAMLVVHRALEKSKINITPDLSHRVAITFSSAVGGPGCSFESRPAHDFGRQTAPSIYKSQFMHKYGWWKNIDFDRCNRPYHFNNYRLRYRCHFNDYRGNVA